VNITTKRRRRRRRGAFLLLAQDRYIQTCFPTVVLFYSQATWLAGEGATASPWWRR